MQSENGPGGDRTPEELQELVRRQADEIASLRRQIAADRFATSLRDVLRLAAVTETVATRVPHADLLDMILETAVQVINARSASILLLDPRAEQLVIEHALGPKAAEVVGLRVPVGHGIAGLVAVTGQPMAVSDASRDPRQASDIAQKVDYFPDSILCVPLVYEERVIGVLELLDKNNAPSFNTSDMELLGTFARQAAIAIAQSRTRRNLVALLRETLQSLGVDTQAELLEQADAYVADTIEDPAYQQAFGLARVVQEVARSGESELQVCRAILQDFASYLRSRSRAAGEDWGFR